MTKAKSKKKIIVHDPVTEWLWDEKSVTLHKAGHFNDSISIHPWVRDNPSVAIQLGRLTKDGFGKADKDGRDLYEIGIFNREDFVEAILAVLPELKRAK